MTTKTLIAGIAGGAALFGMGSLVYLALLPDFFAVDTAKNPPGFLFIILGEVVFGLFMAMLFSGRGINTMAAGAKHGAILGGIIALGTGLIFMGAYDFASMKANLQRANLYRVTGFEKASWIGTDMREINFSGAYLLQRFARDQNYIKEFRERSDYTRFLYYLWWITSDCGRSIMRWLTLICVVGLIYAGLYTQVNINYGSHE